MQKNNQNQYVIGVDGGGTKTVAALSNLKGKILKMAKTGSSSPVNIGVERAAENIAKSIKKVLRDSGILSTFIGLAAVQEQPRLKKAVKREILKKKEISPIFKGKLEIGSDQIVAFRSGTNEKEGVLLIAGTGCVAHGWRKDREVKVSGWGWLNDEGSAFWVGQAAFQALLKDLDKRGPKTKITNLAFKELKVKDTQELLKKVYSCPMEIIPFFSVLADEASKKGDKIAREVLKEAGKELALSTKVVIEGLGFQKKAFPLVLVGGVFKAKIVERVVRREVKKIAPRVKFIRPKEEPVTGAVKLALEKIKR